MNQLKQNEGSGQNFKTASQSEPPPMDIDEELTNLENQIVNSAINIRHLNISSEIEPILDEIDDLRCITKYMIESFPSDQLMQELNKKLQPINQKMNKLNMIRAFEKELPDDQHPIYNFDDSYESVSLMNSLLKEKALLEASIENSPDFSIFDSNAENIKKVYNPERIKSIENSIRLIQYKKLKNQ